MRAGNRRGLDLLVAACAGVENAASRKASSPSTQGHDRIRKLFNYLRGPQSQHYLTIDTEFRRTGHHRRGPGGTIVTAVACGESLVLDPPGLRLSLSGIFEEA